MSRLGIGVGFNPCCPNLEILRKCHVQDDSISLNIQIQHSWRFCAGAVFYGGGGNSDTGYLDCSEWIRQSSENVAKTLPAGDGTTVESPLRK